MNLKPKSSEYKNHNKLYSYDIDKADDELRSQDPVLIYISDNINRKLANIRLSICVVCFWGWFGNGIDTFTFTSQATTYSQPTVLYVNLNSKHAA